VSRWRKKPVVIDAWQFLPAGQCDELPAWIDPRWFCKDTDGGSDRTGRNRGAPLMLIPTPEGTLRAQITDWIIRGVNGEVYPCKADVFAATYEPVQ
jgi:hypothetical protein